MPLNPGEPRLVRAAIFNLPPEPRRDADQIAYDRADFAYREWHETIFGQRYARLEGQEIAARHYFDVPVVTETPVDRFVNRMRKRYA